MEFRIEKGRHDTKSHVVATPSDEEGLFVFKNAHYGIVTAAELVLRNFPGEIQRDIENGDLSRIGSVVYVGYDNDKQCRFASVDVSATVPIQASRNSVGVQTASVQEMAPVIAVQPPTLVM